MYEQIAGNVRRSWILILSFVLLIAAIGWVFGQALGYGNFGLVFALIFAFIFVLIGYYRSDRIILSMSAAREADPKRYPFLHHTVEGLALAAGVPKPKVYIIPDTALNAFAAGRDPEHSVVAVTAGLLEKLDRLELEGVIAHEMSHIKNYDIRVMTLTVMLVGVIVLMSDWMLHSFWWGGGRRRSGGGDRNGAGFGIMMIAGLALAILAPLFANLIRLAVSRQREYLADASGAMLTRYPPGLASALRKISADDEPLEVANKATAHLYIGAPNQVGVRGKTVQLMATHPPMAERIKRLEGMGDIAKQ